MNLIAAIILCITFRKDAAAIVAGRRAWRAGVIRGGGTSQPKKKPS